MWDVEPAVVGLPLIPLDRPTPVPDSIFRENYGGALICCMVMLVLYGLSVLQTYLYYLSYPKDRGVLKILVALLFCVSTLHAVLTCDSTYYYLILTYRDPLLLIGGRWSLYAAPVTGIAVCFLVQLFYTRMIYFLTKGKWRWSLTTILVLLVGMQVATGIVMVIKEFREWDIVKLANVAIGSMVPMLVARVASDLVTALSLCILFHDTRSRFTRSGKLLHTLLIFCINRFLLTTVIVLVEMIVLICSPNNLWAMLIDYISAHLYVNSCLATLNSRNHLHNISESGMEPSGMVTTGHGIQFEQHHGRTAGRDISLINIGLNNTAATDTIRTEMDRSIDSEQKPCNYAVTSAV